jgi:hypothetical protein
VGARNTRIREKDGGHESKGDSSLAQATHVGNPIREEEINTYRLPVIELSNSFNKKKENKRRTKMMIFSFISLRRSMSLIHSTAAQGRKRETSRTPPPPTR